MRFSHALVACVAIVSGGSRPEPPGRALHRMREHVGDLRAVQRMILDGDVDGAKAMAFLLTKPLPEHTDTPHAHEMIVAGARLSEATTVYDVLDVERQVIVACARCHVGTRVPIFKLPPRAPPDVARVPEQMARHEWAANRMLEGLVGPSDLHWRAGVYVLANTALPATDVRRPDLARRLRIAARAIDRRQQLAPTTLEQRAAAYVELVSICASCHLDQVRPER